MIEHTEADPFSDLADGFVDHLASARGRVRQELVARQIAEHLPRPPGRVADIGGGAGDQALRLADAGYHVTLIDPSAAMVERAHAALREANVDVRRRVELVQATGEEAAALFDPGAFDAVLCHGVLMYLDDAAPMVRVIATLTAPGGIISILAKNGSAIAMRAGLEGRYADALEAMRDHQDLGRLGVVTRAETLQELADLLWDNHSRVVEWYGVRVFSDHTADVRPGVEFAELIDAEWAAAQTDPYRQVGRLLHVIARRDVAMGLP